MLKTLRHKRVAKKILITLAVIIIPAFVLWGSGSVLRSRRAANFAGMLFGKKISFDLYNSNLIAVKNHAIMQFGDKFNDIQQFLNFNDMAWDRLMKVREAKRLRIKVNNSEVIERISIIPLFQKDEKFNNKTYQHILTYAFRTPARQFEEQIREMIMIEKMFEEVTKSVGAREDEVLEGYKKENEKVKLSYMELLPDSFINEVVLEEKEIEDYYGQHQDEFKRPPTVNVEYFGMDYPEDIKESEKADIIDKMGVIAAEIKRPDDFKKTSEANKLSIKETGFFSLKGPVEGLGWSYEFIQEAFNLDENQTSDPVSIRKGCYVLKLKKRKDSYIPDIKEIKEEISDILKKDKAGELAKTQAQQYLNTIIETHRKNPKDVDFTKLAKKWALKTDTTTLFNRQDYIPNIGESQIFKSAAFGLSDKNEPYDTVTTETGTFIIKLEEYIPVDQEKFKEEKEDFKAKLLRSKKNEYFNRYFDDLRRSANLVDNVKASLATNSP